MSISLNGLKDNNIIGLKALASISGHETMRMLPEEKSGALCYRGDEGVFCLK